jgi:small GTP-binding protein
MDPVDDFSSDDRKTVSEGFSSRKLKFPPTGIHGSRSDNGDRRQIKQPGNKDRKGAISSRTSKMAQQVLTGDETPDSFASTTRVSSISSSRSSFSSTSDLAVDFATSRSQQIAEMVEASSRLKYHGRPRTGSPMTTTMSIQQPRSRTNSPTTVLDNINQHPPHHSYNSHFQQQSQNHNFQHIHQQHLSVGSNPYVQHSSPFQGYQASPQSLTSSSPASQINYSANTTPSQHLYNKVNPVSSGHTLDLLACESRDSDEEVRIAERIRYVASGDANSDEAYDTFPTNMPVSICGDATVLKIILLGDKKTGKSSLLRQYFDQKYSSAYSPTGGMDNRSKRSVVQGRDCKIQIWDASDSPQSREMMVNYFKGTHCFGIVYDLLDYSTVESVPSWIQIIREKCGGEVPIVLIGNKLDKQGNRAVAKDSIQKYAIDCGLQGYIEASAKSTENVAATIDLLAFLALERFVTVSPMQTQVTERHSMPSGLSSVSEDALLTKYQRNNQGSNDNGFASPLPRKKSSVLNSKMDKSDPGIDLGLLDDDNSSVVSSSNDIKSPPLQASSNMWAVNSTSGKFLQANSPSGNHRSQSNSPNIEQQELFSAPSEISSSSVIVSMSTDLSASSKKASPSSDVASSTNLTTADIGNSALASKSNAVAANQPVSQAACCIIS